MDAINYDLDAGPQIKRNRNVSSQNKFYKNIREIFGGGGGSSGGGSGGGSGGSGGGISDASYNELKDDIDEVNEKLEEYLFNIPLLLLILVIMK